MMTLTTAQDAIDEAVPRIVNQFHPERVILFGSHARGAPGPHSDADLLVVMNVSGSKRRKAIEIDLALGGIPIPTDVIVITPDEVDKYRDSFGTVVHEAVTEGRVLYERAA